jgi:hypothetical protein
MYAGSEAGMFTTANTLHSIRVSIFKEITCYSYIKFCHFTQ